MRSREEKEKDLVRRNRETIERSKSREASLVKKSKLSKKPKQKKTKVEEEIEEPDEQDLTVKIGVQDYIEEAQPITVKSSIVPESPRNVSPLKVNAENMPLRQETEISYSALQVPNSPDSKTDYQEDILRSWEKM